MIYTKGITTSAGGSEGNPTRTVIKVTKGLVWLMEVDFPPGCVGLVNVQIFDGGYQVLPASPRDTLLGDNRLLRYDDLYLKERAPFEFTIVTWNNDELWDHTIQIRIGLASTRLFMARYLPSIGWEGFAKEMEKAREDQEKIRQVQAEEILKILGEPVTGS